MRSYRSYRKSCRRHSNESQRVRHTHNMTRRVGSTRWNSGTECRVLLLIGPLFIRLCCQICTVVMYRSRISRSTSSRVCVPSRRTCAKRIVSIERCIRNARASVRTVRTVRISVSQDDSTRRRRSYWYERTTTRASLARGRYNQLCWITHRLLVALSLLCPQTATRGFGLIAKEDIPAGGLIIEYVSRAHESLLSFWQLLIDAS
jgi:hypothetical protein